MKPVGIVAGEPNSVRVQAGTGVDGFLRGERAESVAGDDRAEEVVLTVGADIEVVGPAAPLVLFLLAAPRFPGFQ
jgi:hypothetical protein